MQAVFPLIFIAVHVVKIGDNKKPELTAVCSFYLKTY